MIKKKNDKSLSDQEPDPTSLTKAAEEAIKEFMNTENIIYSVRLNSGGEFFASLFDFDKDTSCWIFENPLTGNHIDGVLTLSRYEPFSMLQILTVKDVDVSTMTVCNPVFSRYYWASLKFIQQYVDMQVDIQTLEMSNNLVKASSSDASKFNEAMRKHRLRSEDFNLIPY